MIEQYLRKGVCVAWQKPDNVDRARDGQFHKRRTHTTPMTYDGLAADPGAIDAGILANPRGAGLTMGMPIPYKWLDYRPGATAHTTQRGRDVLTGFMSGCKIVRYTDGAGTTQVAHVGTVESEPPTGPTNTLVKTTARNTLPANATGFNPFAAWNPGQMGLLATAARRGMTTMGHLDGGVHIMALVTNAGAFYSILVMQHGAHRYMILGIQLVAPMNNAQLMLSLA